MAWPLFSIYQVRILGANETWISIISVVNGLGAFISYGFWRRIIEKRGNHFALAIAAMGVSSSPFFYSISSSLYQLLLANALVGIAVAGINLTLFNGLLDAVPEQNRTIFIAAYTMLINVSAVIAPMVGIAILDRWNIVIALLVAGGVRLLGTCTFFLRSKKISRVPGQEAA
jgi:MFS family permease